MAKEYVIAEKEQITNIADIIREKTSSSNKISISDMPVNIMSMSGDGGSSVLYSTVQNLTTSQKLQARNNIDAQETLELDNVPREDSTNPITSGGVYDNNRDIIETLYNMSSSQITWDGKIGNREYFYMGGLCYLVKVSEDISDLFLYQVISNQLTLSATVSISEYFDGMINTILTEREIAIEELADGIFGSGENGLYIITHPVVIPLEEDSNIAVTLSRGVWAITYNLKEGLGVDTSLAWVSAISAPTFPIFNKKTIENYFEKQDISLSTLFFEDIHNLPSYLFLDDGSYDVMVNFIRLGDPLLADVGATTFTLNYNVMIGEENEEVEIKGTIVGSDDTSSSVWNNDGSISLLNIVADTDDCEKGLYLLELFDYSSVTDYGTWICNTCSIENYNFTINSNVLKQKYLSNEIILKSSTLNSTKQFKLTVDDSGVINAVEV